MELHSLIQFRCAPILFYCIGSHWLTLYSSLQERQAKSPKLPTNSTYTTVDQCRRIYCCPWNILLYFSGSGCGNGYTSRYTIAIFSPFGITLAVGPKVYQDSITSGNIPAPLVFVDISANKYAVPQEHLVDIRDLILGQDMIVGSLQIWIQVFIPQSLILARSLCNFRPMVVD